MRKFLLAVFSVLICIQLAGCAGWAVRTSSSRKPRVDQEISGNRGFISGKPTSAPKEPTFTDRKVYRIEMEIPQWPQKTQKTQKIKKKPAIRPPKEDKVLWGNRGYIFGGPAREVTEEAPQIYVVPEQPRVEKAPVAKIKEKISQIFEPELKETTEMRIYKVRKGDTLQKISRKFYGTTKKWLLLYKANKDKLKTPDRVYPGQVLVIPEVSEFKK